MSIKSVGQGVTIRNQQSTHPINIAALLRDHNEISSLFCEVVKDTIMQYNIYMKRPKILAIP